MNKIFRFIHAILDRIARLVGLQARFDWDVSKRANGAIEPHYQSSRGLVTLGKPMEPGVPDDGDDDPVDRWKSR